MLQLGPTLIRAALSVLGGFESKGHLKLEGESGMGSLVCIVSSRAMGRPGLKRSK